MCYLCRCISQNESDISMKYNCYLQLVPLKGVLCMGCISPKVYSHNIPWFYLNIIRYFQSNIRKSSVSSVVNWSCDPLYVTFLYTFSINFYTDMSIKVIHDRIINVFVISESLWKLISFFPIFRFCAFLRVMETDLERVQASGWSCWKPVKSMSQVVK